MLNIYKASAGSGKTFTLALEYIKLILGRTTANGRIVLNRNPREIHRHILAITFTVKATEEMKRRIVHEIALLANREPRWTKKSPYVAELCNEFNCTEGELAASANIALEAILNDYSYFTISTIDAFFQTVLRTFAREAELTGNYEVELDERAAIIFGVNEMLSSLNDNSDPVARRHLSDWIFAYMREKITAGKSFDVLNRKSRDYNDLVSTIVDASGEKFKSNYERMMKYLEDTSRITRFAAVINKAISDYLDSVGKSFTALNNYITANSERLYYAIGDKKCTISKNGFSCLKKYLNPGEIKSLGKTEKDVAVEPTNFLSAYGKKACADDTALMSLVEDAFTTLTAGFPSHLVAKAISPKIFMLGLLQNVYKNIRRFTDDNNLILLSDTTSLLRRIIGDDDAPFVFERIGQFFNHFLIDEFQDTSKMQWEILRPLVRNSLGDGNSNLIIGDEKQCIYRFRDSDPSLLRDLGENYPMWANPIKSTLEGNTNWRSTVEVVQFNNTLFLNLGRALGHGDIYNHVIQPIDAKRADKHGYVKVVAMPMENVDAYNNAVSELLIDDINLSLDHGFSPGDIAILVRRRKEGQAIINHLMNNLDLLHYEGLRVVSDDSMGLAAAPVVRIIVSVLKYIAETFDNNHNMLLGKSSAQRIARLINHYEHFVAKGKPAGEALSLAVRMIEEAENSVDEPLTEVDNDVARVVDMTCISLPSLVERIVATFIDHKRAESDNLYISAFQDLALDYSERNGSDLRGFLSWWEKNGRRATVAGASDPNAIRVMTIHKAKGLEFRSVIVPYVNAKIAEFKSPEWFDLEKLAIVDDPKCIPPMALIKPAKWMEETIFKDAYRKMVDEQTLDELNVTYVALTRAVDSLIVYANTDRDTMGSRMLEAIKASTPGMVDTWESAVTPAKPLAVPPLTPLSDCLTEEINLDAPEEEDREETAPKAKGKKKEVRKIEIYTLGEFPDYVANDSDDHTAVEPHEVISMPPYESCDREDIWKDTRLEDPVVTDAGERGIAIHAILSRVRHLSDLDKAVHEAAHSSVIAESEREEIMHYLSERLSREDVREWFEGYERVLLERTFSNTNKLHDHQRPDRVVWLPGGTVAVIDYKTGKEHNSHHTQVAGYMRLLRSMGYPDVAGYLWYLDTDTIHPV